MKLMNKRIISLLLTLVMLCGIMPMTVFATEGTQETEAIEVVTEPTEAPEEEAEGIHTHDYEAVATDPTCTEQGYTTYTCDCDDSYVADYVDTVGHTWGSWTELVAPTCATEGMDQRSCDDCGENQYRDTRMTGDPNRILVSNSLTKDYFAGKRVLLIGDSITAGVGTTKTYGEYLSESLGVTVTNKGSSGSGYCSGGAMATNKNLTEANVRNADIITIMLGVNDWDWAVKEGSWKGNPEYYDKSQTYYQLGDFDSTDTSTFYGALHAWCQKILTMKQIEGFEDKQFIVITPLITSWNVSVTGRKDWNQDKLNIHGHTFREYCTAIMEVCAYYDIPVFDANMFSGIYYKSAEDNNVTETGGDGVHVNAAGHALLAEALEEFLLEGYAYESRSVKNSAHTYVNGICTDCRLPYVCNHTYNAVVTAPTCTEQGYTTYTCECGDSYVGDYTDPRPLNILMIGNSFSWDAADFWYDMQTSMTYDAMKSMMADPYDVHLAVMYKGSATLAYHATCAMKNTSAYTYTEIGPETNYRWMPSSGTNASNNILDQLEARDWDIIVIQSYQHEADGTEPRSTYTGGDARFTEPEASVGYLLDYFAEHEPNADVYYYMPWATTKFYGSDTETGYHAMAKYTETTVPNLTGTNSGKSFAGIIPVGTGIQNARTTYFDALRFSSGTGSTALLKDPQNGLQYDSQHLSFGLGRYIAGIIVAETLIPQEMRKDSYVLPTVKDSPAVGELPQEYSVIGQLAAKYALRDPFKLTTLADYDTELADRVCDAIKTADYSANGIAGEADLQTHVETVVSEKLENMGATEYSVTIHSFTLENGQIADMEATVTLRVGYTSRSVEIMVTNGMAHSFGDWEIISVPSAEGPGLNRRVCEICGFVEEVAVDGSWQKFALAEHLQMLPDDFCSETNLWDLLKPEKLMINHLGEWVSAGSSVYSVTIPVKPGEKIYANSFDQKDGHKGIQVSFIGDYGIVKTTFSSQTYKEFQTNGGYLITPEGAIAVNIPVWNVNADNNTINFLGYDHTYENGVCTGCGHVDGPIITQQPESVQQEIGKKFAITVKAEGDGLTYQWYVKESGAKAFKLSVNKTASYAYTMQTYMPNRQVYCVITDANGNQVTTETATITRPPQALKILEQPKDAQREIGQKFSISPKVEGEGLTYQWYYKESYMKDFAVSSNKTSAYAYTMQSYMHNRSVYCVITDKYGNTVTTDVATISLPPVELKILEQPTDVYAAKGEKFSIKPAVQGDGLTYQWYYKESYMKDFKPSSNKTSAYAYSMQSYMNNRSVYCVITDQYGNQVTTEVVTIHLEK